MRHHVHCTLYSESMNPKEPKIRKRAREVPCTGESSTKRQKHGDVPQPLRSYSVLLLYPDYMAENYGQDTFLTTVKAQGPEQALEQARQEAAESYGNSELQDPQDMHLLLLCEGEITDIKDQVC